MNKIDFTFILRKIIILQNKGFFLVIAHIFSIQSCMCILFVRLSVIRLTRALSLCDTACEVMPLFRLYAGILCRQHYEYASFILPAKRLRAGYTFVDLS